jgi:predicted NBD/HSP70 family sugar kinase
MKFSDVEREIIEIEVEKSRLNREKAMIVLNKSLFIYFCFLFVGIIGFINAYISKTVLNLIHTLTRTFVVYTGNTLAIFEKEFQLPVYVGNDATLAALGEYKFGAGKGCHDMIYITVSTGIGGGVITGGKLLLGTSGFAAEVGHMTIDVNGPRCNCGNIGCLEMLASGTAIARSLQRDSPGARRAPSANW